MPRKSTEELVRRNIKRLISYGESFLELEHYDSIFAENALLNMFSVTEPYHGDLGEYEIYQVLGELLTLQSSAKCILRKTDFSLKDELWVHLCPALWQLLKNSTIL